MTRNQFIFAFLRSGKKLPSYQSLFHLEKQENVSKINNLGLLAETGEKHYSFLSNVYMFVFLVVIGFHNTQGLIMISV